MVTENGGKQDTGKSPASMSKDELESEMRAELSDSPAEEAQDVKNTEDSSTSDDSNNDKREKFIPRNRFDEVIDDRNNTRKEVEDLKSQLSEFKNIISELRENPDTDKTDVMDAKEQVSDTKDEYVKILVESGIEEETAKAIAKANFKVFDNKLDKLFKELRDKEIKPLSDNLHQRQAKEFEDVLAKRVAEFKKVTPDFQERVADMIKLYNTFPPEKKALLDTDPDGLEFLYNKVKKSLPKEEIEHTVSSQIKGRSTSRTNDIDSKSLRKKSLEDLEDEMREFDLEKIK